MAVDAGVPVAKIQQIVGHADTKMTLDYYRPTKAHEAERVRAQMSGTVLEPQATAPAPVAQSIDALIEGMSKAQKRAFMNKLIASM